MLNSLEHVQASKTSSLKNLILSPANTFKEQALRNTLCRIIQCIIREGLLPFTYEGSNISIECPQSQLSLVGEDVIQYRMSRMDIQGPISILNCHLKTPLSSLETLFKILEKEWQDVNSNQLHIFFAELTNSCDNMAIMLEHVHNTQHTLKSLFGTPDLLSLTENLPTNSQALFYEQWASQGHPVHPLVKTKLGFNPEDVIAYSPEFSPTVAISVVAIHTSLAVIDLETNDIHYKNYFSKTFPNIYAKFDKSLQTLSLNPDEYLPLFIHPWQEKNVLPKLYKKWIDEKKIISLSDIKIDMHPSLSFRTLYSSDTIPHIKLPTTILSTTATRTLCPNSVHNSPRVSGVLRDILSKNQAELSTLRLLYDSIGIRINTYNAEVDKQLAMLIRDAISTAVNPSETPIISAALFSNTLKNNTPLLVEIMDAFFNTTQPTEKQVLDYFSHLTHTILQPNLFLYSRYGIALESHQQNSTIIFKKNKPVAILVKDIGGGGVKIHEPTLNNNGYSLATFPNSTIITHDVKETRNKLIHTTYQSLLGEIIILLNKHYNIAEVKLWSIVKEQTQHNLTLFSKDNQEFLNSELQALTQDDWPIKSFIAMRLENQYAQYIYHSTQNPLASCS